MLKLLIMKDGQITIAAAMSVECQNLENFLPNCNIIQTGIGQINSVFAMTNFLSHHNVPLVINIGLVGSHSKDIHTGDLVISDKFFNANSYTTNPHKANDGTHFEEWTIVDWREDSDEQKSQGLPTDQQLITQFKSYATKNNIQNFHIGNIWSGDIWNKEIDTINIIHTKYNTLCEDMESYAIKAICDRFNTPMLSIKVISNNELTGESYDKTVIDALHNVLVGFINS